MSSVFRCLLQNQNKLTSIHAQMIASEVFVRLVTTKPIQLAFHRFTYCKHEVHDCFTCTFAQGQKSCLTRLPLPSCANSGLIFFVYLFALRGYDGLCATCCDLFGMPPGAIGLRPGAARTFSGGSRPIAASKCSRSVFWSSGSSCGANATTCGDS